MAGSSKKKIPKITVVYVGAHKLRKDDGYNNQNHNMKPDKMETNSGICF